MYESPQTEKITMHQFHDGTVQLYSQISVYRPSIFPGKTSKAPENPTTPQIAKKG
jgi:hypothetical protein